jgi:hypothetical protein
LKQIILIEDHGERTYIAADTLEDAMRAYVQDMEGDLCGCSVGAVVINALPPQTLLTIHGDDLEETQTRSCGEWAALYTEVSVLASTLCIIKTEV